MTATVSQSKRKKGNEPLKATDFADENGEYSEQALLELQESERKQQIVGFLKKEYRKCKDQLEPMKKQWYTNLSFYKGDQYVEYINGRMIKRPTPEGRVRLTINRIKPVVRTELSRIITKEPTAEVIPASSDQEDIMRAEAAQSVWQAMKSKLKLQETLEDAAFWVSTCGIGFIKVAWDPKYTEEFEMDGQTMTAEGQHVYTSVTPFHLMVPDLLERNIENQPYVLNVFTKPLEWVKTRYGNLFPEDYKPSVVAATEIIEQQYLNTKSQPQSEQPTPDSCLIIEAWVKPQTISAMPKGGLVTMIDNVIVQLNDDGIPYKHGEFPFAKIENIPSGSFYSTSVIEDLIPVQQEFNRNRSQQVEARNAMSKPGWFYTEGSMNPSKVTTAPGQIIPIKPGAEKPTPIPLPSLPSYVVQEPEHLLRDIEDLSGQHQISKGNTPAGVTAGTALQFLAEQDNSFMATTHMAVEHAIEKVAKQTIFLALQFWDSPRLVRYIGRNKMVTSKYLTNVDFKGATDIRVERGSSLPDSKAARIAMYTDWITRGIIAPEQGLELMGLSSMNDYWEIAKVDENQAHRENLRMIELPSEQVEAQREQLKQELEAKFAEMVDPVTGMPMDPMTNPIASQEMAIMDEPVIPVNEWDNHDVHIEIHTRFMKGQEFEMLDETLKNEFELHIKAHRDAQAQKMMQDLIQQGMQMGDPNDPTNQMQGMEEQGGNPEGNNQFDGGGGQAELDAQPVPQ